MKVSQRNGFPFARRQVLSGALDKGDVHLGDGTNTIAEVKGGKQCETLTPGKMQKWMHETAVEISNSGSWYGFLVTQVKGFGEIHGEWWQAHMHHRVYCHLTGTEQNRAITFDYSEGVHTMPLWEALAMVRRALDGSQ